MGIFDNLPKIIATTDKSLGLPTIGGDIVEEYMFSYNNNNIPYKIQLAYKGFCCGSIPDDQNSCDGSGCVNHKLILQKSNKGHVKAYFK